MHDLHALLTLVLVGAGILVGTTVARWARLLIRALGAGLEAMPAAARRLGLSDAARELLAADYTARLRALLDAEENRINPPSTVD